MKRIVFLCVILFCVLSLSAQQDPQFSQNMFNKLANNPGYAGSTSGISTSVLHRSQWMGFDDEG
ncbi:MAG: type IX secretion system membrane protein PorP/SprF, partial [Flavobacteriales bacterium]|nr:type IX secretion system membrane protein PorP/SprF [Flavobacteriales bacterium]